MTTLVVASNLGGGIRRHLELVASVAAIDVHELREDTTLLAKVRSSRRLLPETGASEPIAVTHGVGAAVAVRHRGRGRRGVRHVEHWHGDPFFLTPGRRVAYRALARAGLAPELQVFTHPWLVPIYHDSRSRFEILPNTVPLQLQPATPRVAASRTAVFLGRLSREKGVEDLLQAWPGDSASRGWTLNVHGSGPSRPKTATPGVTFLGSPADPIDVLARADLVVIPSWTETGPYTACEAMSVGRPFVGSSTGDMPEFLTSGCGWEVPPRDPDRLRSVLIEAQSASPAELADRGQLGRTWLERKRPFEAWASAVERIYAE